MPFKVVERGTNRMLVYELVNYSNFGRITQRFRDRSTSCFNVYQLVLDLEFEGHAVEM